MSARPLIILALVAAGVLAPATTAGAAKAPSSPSISKVVPLRAAIGESLTITGKGFVKGAGKNTVIFRRTGARSVFAKADGLSTTRLRVIVPEKLRPVLVVRGSAAVATKFQLNVVGKKMGRRYTALKASPVIVPALAAVAGPAKPGDAAAAPTATATATATTSAAAAAGAPVAAPPAPEDCDKDGTVDATDTDDDNDLLTDGLEVTLGTNRCMLDTDGDGLEDGWEYQSALHLNQGACPPADHPTACGVATPYPGKRPYPNPLSADAATDYDGDWLNAGQEHEAWKRKIARDGAAFRTLGNLWYSAGLQSSQDTTPAGDGCRGMTVPTTTAGGHSVLTPAYAVYSLDRFGSDAYDGCLNDAERDEDGDYLSNYLESAGPLSNESWWKGNYKDENLYWWASYEGTDWLDGDTDGDQILDGMDDQDYDDFWNMEEAVRGPKVDGNVWPVDADGYVIVDSNGDPVGPAVPSRYGLWVQPFNPCLPARRSRTCPPTIPLDGEVWAPFARDTVPTDRWPMYGNDYVADSDYSERNDVWGTEVNRELWVTPLSLPQPLAPAAPGAAGTDVEHPLPRAGARPVRPATP